MTDKDMTAAELAERFFQDGLKQIKPDDPRMQAAIQDGYVTEVEPGKWEMTELGRKLMKGTANT